MPPRKRAPATVAPAAPTESTAAVAKRFARSINARKGFAGTMVVASEMNPPPPRLSTGSLSFDAAMGGGFPVSQWTEIVGKENSGKGQPVDALVPTPNGWRRIGDLFPGDEVFGADGTPTVVTGVFDRGVLPVYRVRFTEKSELIVDGDHLWDVTNTKNKRMVLPTSELSRRTLLAPDGSGRYCIPQVGAVQYAEQDVPLHPYLLGVYIANGSMTSGAIITTNDENVITEIRRNGYSVSERAPAVARRWVVDMPRGAVRALLRQVGLWGHKSADKSVPMEYLVGSVDQRMSLLRGLMDCDGSISESGATSSYYTRSPELAGNVRELVQSLGGNSRITKTTRDDGVDYRVSVHLMNDVCPFLTTKKRTRWGSSNHKNPVRKIASIEPAGETEVRCITVAADDQLYVTENYIVTHNSTMVLKALGNKQSTDPNYVCCWVASESFDASLAEACGVDLSRVWLIESNDMEFVYNEIIRVLEERAFDMVVIDSYSALVTTQENDKTMEEFTMGGGKVTNQFFRKVGKAGKRSLTDPNDRPWTGIFINQWRFQIGVTHGDPRTTSGGQGKNYAAYCRLDVKRDEWLTDPSTKEKVGQVIKIVVMKMKGAPPQQVGVTDFYFRDSGAYEFGEYDTFKALLSLAEMFDVITRTGEGGRGGSFVDLDGNRYQGREKLINALRADPGQRERVEAEVLRIASKGKVPTEPEVVSA